MRRLFMALAACLAMTAVAPAAVAAPPRSEAEAANQVNSWMIAVGAWSAGYDRVTFAQIELLETLNGGIHTAQTYYTEERTEEGRAWAAQWAPEQRTRLVALRVKLAALSKTPPPLKGSGYDLSSSAASMRPLMDMLAQLPVTTAQEIEGNEILCTQVIDVIERAASGDRSAATYLVSAYFDLNIAMLETEIRTVSVYVATLDRERHPRGSVMRAITAVDESLIAAYRMLRAWDQGKPVDRAAGAAAIRAGAAKIDVAAREMEARTRVQARDRMPGVLGQKQEAVTKSYLESVAVLADMAGRLRSAADVVERGPEFDYDAVATAIEAVTPSLAKFSEMDMQRRALLAQ